ncbi:MAG: hypothetical protein ACYC23_21750, partial [Limisphaerales bacterium]
DPEIVGYLGARAGMRGGLGESGDGLEEGVFTVMEEELGVMRPIFFDHLPVKPLIAPNCLPERCLGVRRQN